MQTKLPVRIANPNPLAQIGSKGSLRCVFYLHGPSEARVFAARSHLAPTEDFFWPIVP